MQNDDPDGFDANRESDLDDILRDLGQLGGAVQVQDVNDYDDMNMDTTVGARAQHHLDADNDFDMADRMQHSASVLGESGRNTLQGKIPSSIHKDDTNLRMTPRTAATQSRVGAVGSHKKNQSM